MRPPQDSWPRGELHVDPRHAAGVGGVVVLVAFLVVVVV